MVTTQKISLFTFTEIVPSPSRSKRPNAARISCSFAPENLFFVFLLFFYHFTLNLRSSSVEKYSGVSDPLPISSLFFKISMHTHSIWPGPHFPCKHTTDYLRWLRLWFCGRCRNNVAPKCTQYSFKEIMGAL